MWIRYLGLRTMNNIGRTPSCKLHYSYKICLMDFMDRSLILTWIVDPENTTKQRKKRAKKQNILETSSDNIITDIYNYAGNASCSRLNCTQSLWFYKGPAEFDTKSNLYFCSQVCLNSKSPSDYKNLHSSRIDIIQLCLQENYHLS